MERSEVSTVLTSESRRSDRCYLQVAETIFTELTWMC